MSSVGLLHHCMAQKPKNSTSSEAKSKLNLGNSVIHIRIVVLYAFETLDVTDWWWFVMACCGRYLVLRKRGSNTKVEKFVRYFIICTPHQIWLE